MGKGLRFIRNFAVLLWTILQALVNYRWSVASRADARARAEWMHTWCETAMRRLRIEAHCIGTPPQSGLVVSNHLSYIDIFVFGSAMPCVFVSKAEVRKWPVFGMLATIAGTVYVDRTRRGDTRNANEGIRRALKQGLRVVIFPEGTSSDGSSVLPFYTSLFEPAVESGMQITAAHIGYSVEDGEVGRDVAYWGEMTFFPHLLNLLSMRRISATVKFSKVPQVFGERKIAAATMREEVVRLCGYSSSSATAAEFR